MFHRRLRVTNQNIAVSCCGCSMFHRADRWPTSALCWTVCSHRYKNRKLSFRRSSQLLKRRRLWEPWVPRMRRLGEDRRTLVRKMTCKHTHTCTDVLIRAYVCQAGLRCSLRDSADVCSGGFKVYCIL